VKTVSVRDLQKSLAKSISASQRERVVITRHGRPAAILIGVEGLQWEHVLLGTDEHFWRTIERRRKEPAVPLSAVKKRLPAD
jgi:prevent-host-death family protein